MKADGMDSIGDLHAFLADKIPFHDKETLWAGGTMPLHVRYFVCDELPPERLPTSVRCLVLRNDSVLVLTNRAGGDPRIARRPARAGGNARRSASA